MQIDARVKSPTIVMKAKACVFPRVPFRVSGYQGICGIYRIELSNKFGRIVDITTPDNFNRHFRDKVVRSAEVQYETC